MTRRRADGVVELDRRVGTPIYRQIYERIRSAILDGRLPPGGRLPSWNDLAGELGVARGTVKAAYDWLAGEGYVVGRGAAGTRVNPELGLPPSASAEPGPLSKGGGNGLPHAHSWAAAPRPFQMGVPALDAFPRALWSRLAARHARSLAPAGMAYQDPAGQAPLRQAIADYLAIARGIAAAPEQIFITAGYAGALDLVSRVLMRTGDAVWFEDPGYPRAREGLRAAGARIVPVPVDEEGLVVRHGLAAAPEARFAVVTPSHQAPLGMPLSLPRRLALLDWASRRGNWIVEDDYYSEFRLTGRALPALKSLDRAGRVLYVGSFSKVLMPSLRLGYVVVPSAVVEAFCNVATFLAPSPSPLAQMTVADFMTQGHFARHIRQMRALYAERRAAVVAALQESFGDRIAIALQESGMHLIAHLREGTDDVTLARQAVAAGFGPVALSPWAIAAPCGPGLVMSFANVPAERARHEAGRLAHVLALPAR